MPVEVMEISIVEEEDICLVYLSGEFVQTAISLFENTMKPLFNRLVMKSSHNSLPVLVDLSGVTFIGSAGIAAMVGIHLDSRHRLIEIGFCGLRQRVLASIQRTKIDQMITIFNDVEEGRLELAEQQRLNQRWSYDAKAILIDEDYPLEVRCLNISKGGCGIFCKAPIPIDSKIYRLILVDANLESKVTILRCQPLTGGFEVAVVFIDRDDRILKLVQDLQNS